MFAAVGAVALVVVASLVLKGWRGHNGGGSSPADATNRLASAVRNEDPVGVLSLVAPGELASVTRELKGATGKAASYKLLKSSSSPLSFLNISVEGLQTKVVDLAPGFARVEFDSGTISYKLDPSQFPKSWKVDPSSFDSNDDQGSVDISQGNCSSHDDSQFDDEPPIWCHDGTSAPFAILVKQNGRWYFSIAYTALEYWRLDEGLPEADFGSVLRAPDSGASSPEGAVTKTLTALGSINNADDVDRILALAPPDELGALYDFRAAINQAMENGDVTFPGQLYQLVGTPTYTTEAGPHDVRVYPEQVEASYTSTDDYTGDTTQGEVVVTRHCVQDSESNDNQPQCLTANRYAKDVGVTDIFVSTVEEHGRWYVSPMGTLADYVDILVKHLNSSTVSKLRNDLNEYDDSGSDGFAAGLGSAHAIL